MTRITRSTLEHLFTVAFGTFEPIATLELDYSSVYGYAIMRRNADSSLSVIASRRSAREMESYLICAAFSRLGSA